MAKFVDVGVSIATDQHTQTHTLPFYDYFWMRKWQKNIKQISKILNLMVLSSST